MAREQLGQGARPAERETDGAVSSTMDRMNRRELVLGTHGRSTEQFNIWQAVFSPVGDDGYPKPIYDPVTGVIDHDVANYWKEHYDLRYILQRDWKTLGPNLVGKLHFTVGDMDSYYLNNAVHLMQDFLENHELSRTTPEISITARDVRTAIPEGWPAGRRGGVNLDAARCSEICGSHAEDRTCGGGCLQLAVLSAAQCGPLHDSEIRPGLLLNWRAGRAGAHRKVAPLAAGMHNAA